MESNFVVWYPNQTEGPDDFSVPLKQAHQEGSDKQNSVNADPGLAAEKEKENEAAGDAGLHRRGLSYGVDDRPPFHIALICAFQVLCISSFLHHLIQNIERKKPVC